MGMLTSTPVQAEFRDKERGAGVCVCVGGGGASGSKQEIFTLSLMNSSLPKLFQTKTNGAWTTTQMGSIFASKGRARIPPHAVKDEAGNVVCQTRNDQQYGHGPLDQKQAGALSFFNYSAHNFATCRHANSGDPRAGHDMDLLLGSGYRWMPFASLSATLGNSQLPSNTVRDNVGNPVCQSKSDEQYGGPSIAAKQAGALSWYKYSAHDYATCR
jgi:hypothetical protein